MDGRRLVPASFVAVRGSSYRCDSLSSGTWGGEGCCHPACLKAEYLIGLLERVLSSPQIPGLLFLATLRIPDAAEALTSEPVRLSGMPASSQRQAANLDSPIPNAEKPTTRSGPVCNELRREAALCQEELVATAAHAIWGIKSLEQGPQRCCPSKLWKFPGQPQVGPYQTKFEV